MSSLQEKAGSKQPSGQSRRDEKTAQVRESIMVAALEVFSEDTFSGARVQDVAKRANVALGTMYNHFENKEDLANEVYRRCKAQSTQYCVDPNAGGSTRETFGLWWATLTNFYSAHPQAFIFLETQDHGRFLDDESRALGAKIDRRVLADFRSWQQSGEIRVADPKLLLKMMIAIFSAIVLEARRSGRPLDAASLGLGEESAWSMLDARRTSRSTPTLLMASRSGPKVKRNSPRGPSDDPQPADPGIRPRSTPAGRLSGEH